MRVAAVSSTSPKGIRISARGTTLLDTKKLYRARLAEPQ